jgi:hypothetical protein
MIRRITISRPAWAILFQEGQWEKRENNRRDEPTGVKYMCIWKCYNENSCIAIIY